MSPVKTAAPSDVAQSSDTASASLFGLVPTLQPPGQPLRCFDISVVIPTYNGATRLPDVLEALHRCLNYLDEAWFDGTSVHEALGTEARHRCASDVDGATLDAIVSQSTEALPSSSRPGLRCEIIVIDNNSTDTTATLVAQYQQTWPVAYPLRYRFEPRPGAGHARQAGVRYASGDLVAFLDDDNIPNPNWLVAAYQFAQEHPRAGAFGSQIHGDFEVAPSPELYPLLPFLAIVERGPKPLLYPSYHHRLQKRILPPSAGLVVRKQAWLDSVPERCLLAGRRGKSMLTGEDLEAIAHIQHHGWEIWYNPSMEIHHKIPSWRLEPKYIRSLLFGVGLSRSVTRLIGIPLLLQPLYLLLYFLSDLWKILTHILQHRSRVFSDSSLTCEMLLRLGALASSTRYFIH